MEGQLTIWKAFHASLIAVFTNGSLLWQPEVADASMEADLALPSLDAGDDYRQAASPPVKTGRRSGW
jgi:hypothetical protein